MGDLAAFILARIADDEAAARAAGRDTWEQGTRRHERNVVRPAGDFDWVGVSGDRLDVPILTAQVSNTPRELFEARAAHIARHDPARVLAQCTALRHVIEWAPVDLGEGHSDYLFRALASIWAEHESFRPRMEAGMSEQTEGAEVERVALTAEQYASLRNVVSGRTLDEVVTVVEHLLADTRAERDLENRLLDAREALRLHMLAQPITEGRDTYSDGYSNGLGAAIQHVDRVLGSEALGRPR